jgi:hypothetical protein
MQFFPESGPQGKGQFHDDVPEPQALADYARRVGAERRNFRRYIIKEQERELYHFDRYIITITDGEVKVRDARGDDVPDDIEPTDEEREQIKAACTSANWPCSIVANNADTLREKLGADATLFDHLRRSWRQEGRSAVDILVGRHMALYGAGQGEVAAIRFRATQATLFADRICPRGCQDRVVPTTAG